MSVNYVICAKSVTYVNVCKVTFFGYILTQTPIYGLNETIEWNFIFTVNDLVRMTLIFLRARTSELNSSCTKANLM